MSANLTARRIRRGFWRTWSGVALLAAASVAQADAPTRNLLVEWRVSQDGQHTSRDWGVRQGQITIDSRRGVIGRADTRLSTTDGAVSQQSVQQLQVLNGGHARLYLGRTVPHTSWQWSVQGGAPQVWSQTTFIDIGQGLTVRPSWPGGSAPVTVELEAQARQPASASAQILGQIDPDGQTRRTEVMSTVQVPLGVWTVIARSGQAEQVQQSGTLSTRELGDSQSEVLEIRISAP